jgi:DNA-binding NarL/FixJ family response regulator
LLNSKRGGASNMVSKTKTSTRIFLVEDHAMVREGLAGAINRESDLTVCGEADEAAKAAQMIGATKPDLAVVDLGLKNSNGLDLIKDLQEQVPGLPILVVSMYEESIYGERAMRAGAKGFITKQEAIQDVLKAIRQILAGEIYLSEKLKTQIARKVIGHNIAELRPTDKLSDRELQILTFIGEGRSARQMAVGLHLDVSTVETYRSRIKEKLGLNDTNELLQYAIRWRQGRSA